MSETVIEHLARAVGVRPRELRAKNMYREREVTPFGQVLVDCNIRPMWSELVATAGVAARQVEVDAFNATHRWRKRGLAVVPVKFGINFTAKFMNQGGALVHVYQDGTVLVTHGGTEMGQVWWTTSSCVHYGQMCISASAWASGSGSGLGSATRTFIHSPTLTHRRD